MTKLLLLPALLLLVAALLDGRVVLPPDPSQESSPPAWLERVSELKTLADAEPWLKIPWRYDLLSARREAAEQGKPILMWIMNGSPLGCT